MERILRLARRLGQAIKESDQYQALESGRQAVESDPDGKTLFDEFYTQQYKVSQLLRQQKPVEAEDKRKLADLQQRLAANDGAKALMKAEADFAELMSRVNKSIHEALLPVDKSDPGSPGREGEPSEPQA